MFLRELFESISPIVYHATNFKSANRMLSNDMVKTPTNEFSTTRSLTGSYHHNNRLVGVIFKLDGNKLNHNFRGRSVGTEDWSNTHDLDDEPEYRGKENKQLEDRLYIPNGIKNFSKYIQPALIYMPVEHFDQEEDEFGTNYYSDAKYFEKVVELLDQYNIPYKFIGENKDLYKRT